MFEFARFSNRCKIEEAPLLGNSLIFGTWICYDISVSIFIISANFGIRNPS